ncbi:MAG: phosphate acyltransferase PlsX [Eubacteriales bacterium]|nr:phosphate acyltransferase PlsX [Eubacteriales bacterium]
MITIALDVMGGDYCPDSNIEGALDALKEDKELKLLLVGPSDLISEKISDWDPELKERAEILNATEVISPEESPVFAVRKKKDSTLVVGSRAVKEGRAEALVSAGSTGAVLGSGQLVVGRLPGVLRPPLASLIPTKKGFKLFLDMGANVDAKPEWLLQFAMMGTIYMQQVCHLEAPQVKLVNLGTEEEKGNALTKGANELLKAAEGINYQGYIESRDVIMGEADVIVADAFTGNAILKTMEGTVDFVMGSVKEVLKSSLKTKLAAMLIMKPLKAKLKEYSASEQGGAMLLGLNGLVMKCHGNASGKDIRVALIKSAQFARENVCGVMREAFKEDKEQ